MRVNTDLSIICIVMKRHFFEILIESEDARKLETQLHKQFEHCRIDGEWFDLTLGDLEILREEFADQLVDVEQYNG